MYDTIECQLSNLIDIQQEGENDTKEVTIILEKKMTVRLPVINTPEVKGAMRT